MRREFGSRRGRGGGGRGSGGRGRPYFGRRSEGPPDRVVEAGSFLHAAEEALVFDCVLPAELPMFSADVFLENKTKIGAVEEILGPITKVMFTVKLDNGFQSSSFEDGSKVFLNPEKTLPLTRFTDPKQQKRGGSFRGGRDRGRGRGGGGRGSRGGNRGGRGGRFHGGRGNGNRARGGRGRGRGRSGRAW